MMNFLRKCQIVFQSGWILVFLFVVFFLSAPCLTRRILVPWPGIKPTPLVLEVWSFNHWTAREIPVLFLCLGLWSILSWLFYMYDLGVKVISPSIPMWTSCFSSCVEKTILSPLKRLDIIVENQLNKYVCVYFCINWVYVWTF